MNPKFDTCTAWFSAFSARLRGERVEFAAVNREGGGLLNVPLDERAGHVGRLLSHVAQLLVGPGVLKVRVSTTGHEVTVECVVHGRVVLVANVIEGDGLGVDTAVVQVLTPLARFAPLANRFPMLGALRFPQVSLLQVLFEQTGRQRTTNRQTNKGFSTK